VSSLHLRLGICDERLEFGRRQRFKINGHDCALRQWVKNESLSE
jgi:hypothetical protein